MAQVTARIVLAQAGNAAPGGYVDGGRDDLVVGSLITATNADNAGAVGHKWVVTPCAALAVGDYGVSGTESPTLTLTPPSPDGYGDLFLELTVYGAPLANGQPNIAIDRVPLGVRATASGYAPGIPIPSWKETSAGGRGTLSAAGGRELRLQEFGYALVKQVKDAGLADAGNLRSQNGSGTPTAFVGGGVTLKSGSDKLAWSLDVGSKTFTLSIVDFVESVEDEDGHVAIGALKFLNTDKTLWTIDPLTGEVLLEIDAGASAGVSSIKKFGLTPIYGDVDLEPGDGVVMTQSGQKITFAASQFRANGGAYVSGDLTFADTASVTVSRSGGTFSFTGFALPAGYEIVLSAGTIFHRYTASTAGAGGNLSFLGQTSTGDDGGSITVQGGGSSTNAKHGGNLSIIGGAHTGGGGAPGKGGDVSFRGGTSDNDTSGETNIGFAHGGAGVASGGPVNIGGGDASGAANGGPVNCFAGAGPTGAKTKIGGGKGTSGAGGDIELGSGHCTTGTNKVSLGTFNASFVHTSWCTVEASAFTVKVGRLVVQESSGVVKQIADTCAPLTTTSTTATLVWSYALGTSEHIWITVQATGDPGTAAAFGGVVYTAAFRRTVGDNSGNAQQCGTTGDISPNVGVLKNGFAVTIALNSNTVEVKVVAPNATSTLWSVTVGGQARTGPV